VITEGIQVDSFKMIENLIC